MAWWKTETKFTQFYCVWKALPRKQYGTLINSVQNFTNVSFQDSSVSLLDMVPAKELFILQGRNTKSGYKLLQYYRMWILSWICKFNSAMSAVYFVSFEFNRVRVVYYVIISGTVFCFHHEKVDTTIRLCWTKRTLNCSSTALNICMH